MKNESTFERLNRSIRYSLTARIATVAFLALILMLPVVWIQDLIYERQNTQNSVINEVSSKWGLNQTVQAISISIPYKERIVEDKNIVEIVRYAHFLPENLDVKAELVPEIRKRRIYEVVVYNSTLVLKGNFGKVDLTEWKVNDADIKWDEAFVTVGISDVRGIADEVMLQWNDKQIRLNPGIPTDELAYSGMSARVPLQMNGGNYQFEMKLNLRGSSFIQFVPVGRKTTLHMTANWGTPSFSGAFLPVEKTVTETEFSADWTVLDLNRNYPQQWVGSNPNLAESAFGVDLLVPIDDYQKTTRAAKYAIMFIALTFMVFFIIEVLQNKRVHPIQYMLTGLALIVFYTLLLSISEYWGFGPAYLISSVMVILLLMAYVKGIFKSNKHALIQGGILTFLYGFLFVLLQLEDYALLIGSLGLFVILAIVMMVSLKIDWYQVQEGSSGEEFLDSSN